MALLSACLNRHSVGLVMVAKFTPIWLLQHLSKIKHWSFRLTYIFLLTTHNPNSTFLTRSACHLKADVALMDWLYNKRALVVLPRVFTNLNNLKIVTNIDIPFESYRVLRNIIFVRFKKWPAYSFPQHLSSPLKKFVYAESTTSVAKQISSCTNFNFSIQWY